MSDEQTGGGVAEIARTLRPAFRVLPDLLEAIAKPGAAELGVWIRDEVATLRRRRLAALDARLTPALEGRARATEQIDPVYLLDVLDAASRAPDDDVTDLWAKLVAANVEFPASRHPLYVRLLAAMSKSDAMLFANFCNPSTAREMSRDELVAAGARLLAAGLLYIEQERPLMGHMVGLGYRFEGAVTPDTLRRLRLSALGRQLGEVLRLVPSP